MILPFLMYGITATIGIIILYIAITSFEHIVCLMKHNAPLVPSTRALRRAIISEIQNNCADMKTVCDIGSGYGGLVRGISRKCKMRTVGLENMPFAAMVSKIGDKITFSKNKTIWCDALDYLDKGHNFDIGVLYLAPWQNKRLGKYAKNFHVMISAVVPIDDLTPTRIVTLGRGYTLYGWHRYPYKLYIYECKNAPGFQGA